MSKPKQTKRVIPAPDDTLINVIPQLVWVARPDGWHEYVNQRWCDYTGFTLEQGHRVWAHFQFIHPDDRESNRAHWQHALDTGVLFEHEERLKQGQTGEYHWFLTRAIPMRDKTGQIVTLCGTCTNIDAQKRIEAALHPGQELANALMKCKMIGCLVCEGEQVVDANDTFLRMIGYTRKDLDARRLTWVQITSPEDLARTLQALQELTTRQQLSPYEKAYVCQDGCRFPAIVCGFISQQNPRLSILFVLDNCARKGLEQRLEDFINLASHELRTPLTAIKLQTQLVRKRLAKHAQHEAATELSWVEVPIKQLERLIDELLDASQTQSGRGEYIWEAVNLDELLREVADTMQHMSPSHAILVRGSAQTRLMGDPNRLRQVFTNLLSNAITYSPDARTVEVEVFASDEAVTIQVRDHGLGIPHEFHEKIFERFSRANVARQQAVPGLGIGLYLVTEIVKGYGGTITVDSEVGNGSTFTVTFPLKRDAWA